jgi:hypothetical protein
MHIENGRTPPPPSYVVDCFAMLRYGQNIPSFKDRLLEKLTESLSFQLIGPLAIVSWWKVFCGNYSFLAMNVHISP